MTARAWTGTMTGLGRSAALLVVTAWLVAAAPAATAVAAASCSGAGVLRVRPGDDVVRLVDRAGEGRTICFSAGTYRLTTPLRPRARQQLVGQGAVLSGARVLAGFARTASGWAVGGQTQQGQRNGVCLRSRPTCAYPDDVLRDGVPMRRVLAAGDLGPGAYWFDYAHDAITVHDDPRGHHLEALVAPAAVQARPGAAGADVTVRGFTVEHCASVAQHGAVEVSAPGWLLEDDVVRDDHGAGITTQGEVRVVRDRVLRNGQLGIGGVGRSTLVSGNEIAANGGGGYDPAWEAGGAKWAVTVDLVVTGNDVHDNTGPGLWTDVDARDTTYADNVVRDNSWMGIFHEISGSATIRDNVVTGNGHGFDTWLWGSGILLAASHDVQVTGNRLAGNAEGLGLIQQDRGRSSVDGSPRLLHDIAFRDNTVTMSGAASGGVTDDGYERMFTDPTITWTGDTWRGAGGTPYSWADRELTAAQWRALGHDAHG